VMLTSNTFGEGLDPASGGVAVDTVQEIPGAVHELLDDPSRLAEIAHAGYVQARAAARWEPFVERVGAALAAPDLSVARFTAGRAALGTSLRAREDRLHAEQQRWRAERAAAVDQLEAVRAEERKLAAALAAAEWRYRALRERKVVRAGLRLGAALERLRAIRGRR
jgi:hypothetical protein